MSIEYTVRCDDPAAHEFLVEMEASLAGEEALVLRLPTWIPGSYLIREFARHLLEFEAEAVLADGSRRPLAATKIDKCSWRIVPPRGACALRCRYRVWAFDASVREAWLDTGRGFFNGTSLFLRLEGEAARNIGFDSFRRPIPAVPDGKWPPRSSPPRERPSGASGIIVRPTTMRSSMLPS